MDKHNAGSVPHTSKYGPWRPKTYVAFSDEEQAVLFERYLKSAGRSPKSVCDSDPFELCRLGVHRRTFATPRALGMIALREAAMNAVDERSVSLWMDTAKMPDAPRLEADEKADVVVVGSGIAGLSTAYELSRLGEGIVVLDRGSLGGGMTSRTSAHLTSNIDDLYHELIKLRGEKEARSYCSVRKAAIDRIEEIQAMEKIDCDFSRLAGYLFPAKSDDASTLEAELDACRRVGLRGVKWVDETPIPDAGAGPSLMFPNQARFHPRKSRRPRQGDREPRRPALRPHAGGECRRAR